MTSSGSALKEDLPSCQSDLSGDSTNSSKVGKPDPGVHWDPTLDEPATCVSWCLGPGVSYHTT